MRHGKDYMANEDDLNLQCYFFQKLLKNYI